MFLQSRAFAIAEGRDIVNIDQKKETFENLEPVELGRADALTEFGPNGGDDNSRSDFWWWF